MIEVSTGTQNFTAANLNSVVSLTVPASATFCRVYVTEAVQGSGNRLLVTEDGSTPSSSNGGVLPAGFYTFRTELGKLRLLNETSGGCRAAVFYYTG